MFVLPLHSFDFLAGNETREPPKKKLTMSFEVYKNLSNMLILYMRSEESRVESEGILDCITINIAVDINRYEYCLIVIHFY